jgi:putative glutamine amidotransferase
MAKSVIGITPSLRPREKRGDGMFLYVSYPDMIASAGALPVMLPFASTLEEAREITNRVDGILLTGGDDLDPARYGQIARHPEHIGPSARNDSDLLFARAAQERGTPALGICLGVQVMNVEFGGTLLQMIPEDLPGALAHEEENEEAPEHTVRVAPGTTLARVLGVESAVVNSFHHQSIDRVAQGFRVAAKSEDGIVEAIERTDHPFYIGVQWHPERMPSSPLTRRLVGAFLDAARGAPLAT